MWKHLLFGFGYLVFSTHGQTLGGICRTPLNEPAKCINVYECESAISLLKVPTLTPEQIKFLESSKCGFDSQGTPYVCCTNKNSSFHQNPLIPDRNHCGLQFTDRIIYGQRTALDEFPWMALLEYIKPSGKRTFACAGSLISSRYILTAAHCVKGRVVTTVGKLANVRLAEYDISSPGRDCVTQKNIVSCNQEEANIGIEKIIPHPEFSDGQSPHDIALIRLASEVSYTDFIKPICLPLPNEESLPGNKVLIAGWGITEEGTKSKIKLKVEIPIRRMSDCSNVYTTYSYRITDGHICAGGGRGGDSCRGDSGGPLMRTIPTNNARWMIEGLVSFGFQQCGVDGYPGVYTKVAKYLTWIHSTVEP